MVVFNLNLLKFKIVSFKKLNNRPVGPQALETSLFSPWIYPHQSIRKVSYMCAIAGFYISSLFLFPGFVTSVKPLGKNLDYLQRNGIDPSRVPVILVTTYNSCNLCGKILSSFIDPKRTSPSLLLQGSLARFMIVPVFLFCVYPQDSPYFYDVRIPFALTVMLGISNGYFGSASMIIAPQPRPRPRLMKRL